MAKKKRRPVTCRTCRKPGHIAKTCPQTAGDPKPKHFALQDRGAARRRASAGGSVADTLREEIAKREREITALRESLVVLGG